MIDLLLWEPKHGARKRGSAELKSIMGNRKEWIKLVNGVRARSKQASKQARGDTIVLSVTKAKGESKEGR